MTATLTRPEVSSDPHIVSSELRPDGRIMARIVAPRSGKQTPYEVLLAPNDRSIWPGHLLDSDGHQLEAVPVSADVKAGNLHIGSIKLILPLTELREMSAGPVDPRRFVPSEETTQDVGMPAELVERTLGVKTEKLRRLVADGKLTVVKQGVIGQSRAIYSKRSVMLVEAEMESLKDAGRPADHITVGQAMELAGVSAARIYQLAQAGKIKQVRKGVRGGRKTAITEALYSQESIAKWMSTRKRSAASKVNASKPTRSPKSTKSTTPDPKPDPVNVTEPVGDLQSKKQPQKMVLDPRIAEELELIDARPDAMLAYMWGKLEVTAEATRTLDLVKDIGEYLRGKGLLP